MSEEAITPKSSARKRAASASVVSYNSDTHFAWACFKSTGQAVNYDELGRLCQCSKDAARKRYYRMRDSIEVATVLGGLDAHDDNTPTPTPGKKRRQKKDSSVNADSEPKTPCKKTRVKKEPTEEESEAHSVEEDSVDIF